MSHERWIEELDRARQAVASLVPELASVRAAIVPREFAARRDGQRVADDSVMIVAVEALPDDETGVLATAQIGPADGLVNGRALGDVGSDWVDVAALWNAEEVDQLWLYRRVGRLQAELRSANLTRAQASRFGEEFKRALDACLRASPATVTEKIEFTVGPDTREVDGRGVEALDDALTEIGSGELLHLVDPRRINAFSSGGPATWSVAFVPVGDDHFFVTYGNSDRIDPGRRGVSFELSVRVPARCAGLWPGLLLRQLVRYMLKSGRELRVADFMPFPTPVTRVAGGADDPAQFPSTGMDAVFLVPDPVLPSVDSPRGPIEIRRVVGMFPDERELMEPWSVRGLADVMRKRSPDLITDIERASFATERAFVDAMAAGSRAEGSQFGFVAVPGVTWEATGAQCTITLPGGRDALRIHRMVEARLHHGRNLLIHDVDPEQRLAVALEPADEWDLVIQGDVAVLYIPLDAPHLKALANAPAAGIVWKLG